MRSLNELSRALSHPLLCRADRAKSPVLFGCGKPLQAPKTIVISGATSGVGRALALHYAKPGVTLALMGRNEARLAEVAKACTGRCGTIRKSKAAFCSHTSSTSGAAVKTAKLDVTDKAGMEAFLLSTDKETPVECVPEALSKSTAADGLDTLSSGSNGSP